MRKTRSALTSAFTVALSLALSVALTSCSSDTTGRAVPPQLGPSGNPTADAVPVVALRNLTGVHTELVLDPVFLAGIKALKLTLGVTGTATLDPKTGTVTFPITSGNVTYYTPGSRVPFLESSIKHDGSGISLTDGTTKVALANFTIDAGKSTLFGDVTANGKNVVDQADLMFFDGRTLKPLDTTTMPGQAILDGTTVSFTKDASDLLNTTYKTAALPPFYKIGVAKITLTVPAFPSASVPSASVPSDTASP